MKKYIRKFVNLIYKFLSFFVKKEGVVIIFTKYSQSFENLPIIESALTKNGIACKVINENVNIFNLYILSSAKVVFIDQATLITSYIKLNCTTHVVQIWHAGGAFKKFGYDASSGTLKDERRIQRIHGNIKWIVTSSTHVSPIYSNAFRIPIKYVLPLGIPRTDIYLKTKKSNNRVYKTILYAPTFRVDKFNQRTLNDFSETVCLLKKILIKQGFRIAVRLHPTISSKIDELDVLDWSKKSLYDALSNTDVLITDYSSILFDYSLFHGRIFWYINDLDKYEVERGIYFNPLVEYPKYSATDIFDLCDLIVANHIENCTDIRKKYMNACDGQSTDRIIKFIKELL